MTYIVPSGPPYAVLGSVRHMLDELPWAALLVDALGSVRAANVPAHALFDESVAGLLGCQFRDLLTTAAAADFQAALAGTLSQPAFFTITLTQPSIRSSWACGVQSAAGDGALFVVALWEPALPHRAAIALNTASARCFKARTRTAFFDYLQAAVAPFALELDWVQPQAQPQQWQWFASTTASRLRPLPNRDLSITAADLLAPTLQQVTTWSSPPAVSFLDSTTDTGTASQNHAALLRRMLWRERCVLVPLVGDERHEGFLVVSGPGLQPGMEGLLESTGEVLALAAAHLWQQDLPQLSQAQIAKLLHAGQAITAVTELNDVLRVICEQALQLSGGTTASLLMPEPEGDHLRCVMALGAYSDALLGRRCALGTTIAGQAFQAQRSFVVDDVAGEPADAGWRAAVPLRGGLFLPLQAQARPIGVLSVWHPEHTFFEPNRLHILEQLGCNAAVAIENAQLHEAMRRSEERYRTLFQNALEIVVTLDLQGRIVAWNRAALQFLGMSPAELRGGVLNIRDLVQPETAALMAELQARALQGDILAPTEVEMCRPGGTPAVVELTVQMFQEHGQPQGLYLIGRDRTERYRQRQALTEQVAQLTALHNLSSSLSSSLDPNAILQHAAEAIALANRFDWVGFYIPDTQRQSLELTVSVGIDAVVAEHVRHAGPGSTPWAVFQSERSLVATTNELKIAVRDLFHERGVRGHAFVPLMASSGAHGVIVIGRSNSEAFSENDLRVVETMATQIAQAFENIQLYAAVEQSAARYRDLYENANDFIGTMTLDGTVTSLNRAALRFLGYTAADISRLSLRDLLPAAASSSVEQVLATLCQSHDVTATPELRVVRQDGSLAMLEIRSRLVFEGDLPTAIHFIARDITERRQLEAQVRQGEKLAALGQLVAGAAHELNNPLAVVLGTTQLLLREPMAVAFRDDVRNIEAAAQRANHIIKQMLTFAREHEDVRAPVELPLLVERVLQGKGPMLQQHAVEVSLQFESTLPRVWGDAYQLEQVLDNLLHNAMQALTESRQSARRIVVAISAADTKVRLSVTDNGPGIAAHVLPRIFDPFFTTKEVGSGTGLGLSLVFGIVDKHGGSIWAESVPGQGATFVVELPASAAAVPDLPIPAIQAPANCSILVVEDEFDVRAILERALTQHGYSVDVVESAERALTMIADQQYDLIITDIRMPGMNGRDLFERVRHTQPQLNWVFITGDTMSAQSEAFLKKTGVPCLPKPFTLDELWEAVAMSILGSRKPAIAA